MSELNNDSLEKEIERVASRIWTIVRKQCLYFRKLSYELYIYFKAIPNAKRLFQKHKREYIKYRSKNWWFHYIKYSR